MLRIIRQLDIALTLSILFLIGLGLTILSSVAPELLAVQTSAIVIGLVAYLLLTKINFATWLQFNKLIYLLCLLFLISPFVFGIPSGGAHRWLQFGTVNIQPSEIVRPFLLVILAHTLSTGSPLTLRGIFKSLIILALPAYIIFRQPDLGVTLALLVGWFGIIVTKGLNTKQVILGVVLIAIILPVSWNFLHGYQKDRIITFFNPGQDPLNTGYHVLQSQIAVGSGQLFGRGLGRGTQSHLRFLPERHTDFVFASLAEELGLAGSLLVLVLYLVLFIRFIQAMHHARSELERLMISGLLTTLSFQVFVNIGMNLGILPITGVTLPLLSYGGSSVVATFISLGIVNNILVHARAPEPLHIR